LTEVASSTSIDSSGQTKWLTVDVEDWQGKIYQKLQSLKEVYYPQLKELHDRIADKLQHTLPP